MCCAQIKAFSTSQATCKMDWRWIAKRWVAPRQLVEYHYWMFCTWPDRSMWNGVRHPFEFSGACNWPLRRHMQMNSAMSLDCLFRDVWRAWSMWTNVRPVWSIFILSQWLGLDLEAVYHKLRLSIRLNIDNFIPSVSSVCCGPVRLIDFIFFTLCLTITHIFESLSYSFKRSSFSQKIPSNINHMVCHSSPVQSAKACSAKTLTQNTLYNINEIESYNNEWLPISTSW